MDRRSRAFILAGLVVTLAIAAVVSGFASSEPDGLEKVSIDTGFDDTASDHALAELPLADYGVEGIDNDRLSTGIAGLIGVALTLAVTIGLLFAVRRLRRTQQGTG